MHESLLFSLEFAALASHTLATKTNFSSVRPFPCYEVIIIVIDLRISHAADTARAKKINYFSLFPSLASKVLCFLSFFFVGLSTLSTFGSHTTQKRSPGTQHEMRNALKILPPLSQNDFFLLLLVCYFFSLLSLPSNSHREAALKTAFTEEEKKKLIFHFSTRRVDEAFLRARLCAACFTIRFNEYQLLTYTCTIHNLNLTNMNSVKALLFFYVIFIKIVCDTFFFSLLTFSLSLSRSLPFRLARRKIKRYYNFFSSKNQFERGERENRKGAMEGEIQ